ncbi:MAG TPA: response regulator transcription factor [Virgibacillus sp.]|nr:response regulator transcription factor [Virgibacillus sp.]HLR65744.1 response regulator transcription factor [Virgibacillus sp.]
MSRLLYIEDDSEIGSWLEKELCDRGYDVTWLISGEGIGKNVTNAELVILDVMLPGLDGFSIGKRIKNDHPDLPILMLSARTAVEDKLEGLSFADDYVTKPFHPDELIARIEVLLRRFSKSDKPIRLQHLTINPVDYQIKNIETGGEIILTKKQYAILQYFLKNANQILTKEQIYEHVWEEDYLENDKTLMVHIRYLREKIEKDAAHPTIIETIRGIGYRLKE